MDFWTSIQDMVMTIPVLDNIPVLRGILGSLLVFFIPGFAWTLILFKHVNLLERLVLAIGLSIALVTLCVYGLNIVLDVPINGGASLVIIIVLTAIPLGIYYGMKYLHKRRARN